MNDASPATAPKTFYLKDYTPFGYEVESVHLTFRLAPETTRVLSTIRFAPKPDAADKTFFLHGEELQLISAKIDGQEVKPELVDGGLKCEVPSPLTWEAEWRSTRPAIPRWRGFTCPTACIAPSARPRASARSPSTPTAPT